MSRRGAGAGGARQTGGQAERDKGKTASRGQGATASKRATLEAPRALREGARRRLVELLGGSAQ
eukprot:4886207-Pyramimonas_sp.AAC.1